MISLYLMYFKMFVSFILLWSGVIYLYESQTITFNKEMTWLYNTAGSDGGENRWYIKGTHLVDRSIQEITASHDLNACVYLSERALTTGVVYLFECDTLTFNGDTIWSGNMAGGNGGETHAELDE